MVPSAWVLVAPLTSIVLFNELLTQAVVWSMSSLLIWGNEWKELLKTLGEKTLKDFEEVDKKFLVTKFIILKIGSYRL